MLAKRKMAALGLTAGLVGGGAAGMVLGTSPLSGASDAAVVQDEPAADQPDADQPDADRPEAGERLSEALAPLVEDGTLTQAQADAVVETLMESAPARPRTPRLNGLKAAAEAIGVETRDLAEALRDGSTIADVAAEAGVDAQSVIDAMVADASEHLSEKVADGTLTQEEADAKLAELTDRVTDLVNNGRPERLEGEGHGPMGGAPGPQGGDVPTAPEGEN